MNDVGSSGSGGMYVWPLGWVPMLEDTPENRGINRIFAQMYVEDQHRRAQWREEQRRKKYGP